MSEFKWYRPTNKLQFRPYIKGENLVPTVEGYTVYVDDTYRRRYGSPRTGDMIAISVCNPGYCLLIPEAVFKKQWELV